MPPDILTLHIGWFIHQDLPLSHFSVATSGLKPLISMFSPYFSNRAGSTEISLLLLPWSTLGSKRDSFSQISVHLSTFLHLSQGFLIIVSFFLQTRVYYTLLVSSVARLIRYIIPQFLITRFKPTVYGICAYLEQRGDFPERKPSNSKH